MSETGYASFAAPRVNRKCRRQRVDRASDRAQKCGSELSADVRAGGTPLAARRPRAIGSRPWAALIPRGDASCGARRTAAPSESDDRVYGCFVHTWQLRYVGQIDHSVLGGVDHASAEDGEAVIVGRWSQAEVVALIDTLVKAGADIVGLRQIRD